MLRPISLRAAFSSATPRLIVLRASPIAAATAVTPPRPSDIASLAANSRRPRSSRNGDILANRLRTLLTSITTTRYRYSPLHRNDISILLLRSLDHFDSIISRQVLSSSAPLWMRHRPGPFAAATAVTPPRPSDIASLAANSRRP